MWRKEIRFDFEQEVEPWGEEGSMMFISGCRQWACKMTVTLSVRTTFAVEMERKTIYKGENEDYLKAILKAFQNFLDKRVYSRDCDVSGRHSYYESCPYPLNEIPLVLKIDHLTPGLQEVINQLFDPATYEGEAFIKLLK